METNIRIAWVEDDTPIIEHVVYRLERAGYKIDIYRNYAEAMLAKDVILQSNLILLDIIIPNGTANDVEVDPHVGLKLVRDLHRIALGSERRVPPVLILSAVTNGDVIERFKKEFEGAILIDHLRKPTLPTTLKEKVDSLLGASSHEFPTIGRAGLG